MIVAKWQSALWDMRTRWAWGIKPAIVSALVCSLRGHVYGVSFTFGNKQWGTWCRRCNKLVVL